MAQETRLAPIEFDRTPTQVLLNMAESKKAEALKQQQLAFEQAKYLRGLQEDEMKRRYENAASVNTILQDPKWSAESRDNYMKSFLDLAAKAKDTESFDFRKQIATILGDISSYDRYVKDAYAAADDFIKNMPETTKKGFSADVFKNRFIQNALTKDGRPLTLDETRGGVDRQKLLEVYEQNKSDLYDLNAGYDNLRKRAVTDAPISEDLFSERDQKGNLRTGKSINKKWRNEFQTFDKDTGEIKLRTDEFGYLEEPAYKFLISDPAVDALATRNAKQFINNYNNSTKEQKLAFLGSNSMGANKNFVDRDGDGLPDLLTIDDLDLVKKGFITDYVRRMPEFGKDTESTTIVNMGGSGANATKDVASYDVYSGIDQKYSTLPDVRERAGGKVKTVFGKPLSSFDFKEQSTVLDMVNRIGKKKSEEGEEVAYTQADVTVRKDKDGNYGVYSFPENKFILNIDKTGTNLVANKDQGQKVKQKILKENASTPGENSGKVISKEEFIKMSIPDRQKFKSAGGTIK
jgi:hypothetical protein